MQFFMNLNLNTMKQKLLPSGKRIKNQDDGRKADGAILKDEKAIAVIELKSTKTKDFKKVTEQDQGLVGA